MAIKQALKISRKTFFNPRAWLGYDSLREDSRTIWTMVLDVLAVPGATEAETFEEAKERLGLSEENLQTTVHNYLLYALLFVVLGTLMILYSFYLIIGHKLFWGWLLSLSIAGLFYANDFRYHFWVFQIKQRKLGCTFEEWRQGFFSSKDKKNH